MTAKLATVDDHILAGREDAGAMRGGNIVLRSASDKSQGGFTQFDSGYLSPYFVTDPERMEVGFENAYIPSTKSKSVLKTCSRYLNGSETTRP